MREPKPYFKKSHQCWYVNLKGRTIRLDPDESKATQLYHEIMAAGKEIAPQSTVRDLIGRFLKWTKENRAKGTYHWYAGHLEKFGKHIGPRLTIDKVKPLHVEDWVKQEYGKNASANYVNGAIRTVVRCFNWAVKKQLIPASPIAGVERPTPTHGGRVIEDAEWKALLDAIDDLEFRDFLVFIRLTGCRPQEARTIETRDFISKPPQFMFEKGDPRNKNKKRERVIPLPAPALAIVQPLMLKNSTGTLFRNADGNSWNKDAINSRLHRLKEKAGFKLRIYDIRHTWGTRAIENGVDIATVADIMGHADATMLLKVYAHLLQNKKRLHEKSEQAIGNLDAILGVEKKKEA